MNSIYITLKSKVKFLGGVKTDGGRGSASYASEILTYISSYECHCVRQFLLPFLLACLFEFASVVVGLGRMYCDKGKGRKCLHCVLLFPCL